jgi:hypothetical protein
MGIREIIRELAGTSEGIKSGATSVICTVDGGSVDTTALTCTLTPVGRSDKYYGARLSATSGVGKSVVIIPKEGSYVIASVIHENDVFVSMVEDAEKIIIRSEEFGGLVKVEELVSRLNAIETAFNNLLTDYKAHSHSGAPPTTYPCATILLPSTQTNIQTTQREQLENKEVLHG